MFASLSAQANFVLFLSWPWLNRFQTSLNGRSQLKGFVNIETHIHEASRPGVTELQKHQNQAPDACTDNWLGTGRHTSLHVARLCQQRGWLQRHFLTRHLGAVSRPCHALLHCNTHLLFQLSSVQRSTAFASLFAQAKFAFLHPCLPLS